MKQTAADKPVHSYQRKAAIVTGGIADHSSKVHVKPIEKFDLNRTIFNTLEGNLPRKVIQTRIAKDVSWENDAARAIDAEYEKKSAQKNLPPIDPKLIAFMKDECDFDVEHADGSFFDHLFYCYEYSHFYYPQHSALVMLLHSILGTGTNTFAMPKEKIPQLKPLMSDFDWRHVEAFPSVLRLLYGTDLLKVLENEPAKLNSLKQIKFHRVIDNAPITMSGEDFWIQLNYQIIHLTDFIPVSNWPAHSNDSSFILFRKLYKFMTENGKLEAKISYEPPPLYAPVKNEELPVTGWLLTLMPTALGEWMTAQSIRKFSQKIGHDLKYELNF
ncbi:MAG: hypothetical protein JNJ69_15040 [Leptospiraceae bacterium]|nr:hypothetical protein [Leptospiraceae bacterium]